MTTLQTSLEANCDRQAGRQREKAIYRGSSYGSASKAKLVCQMDLLRQTIVLDCLVLVSLVWYGFILVYCYLSYFQLNFGAVK